MSSILTNVNYAIRNCSIWLSWQITLPQLLSSWCPVVDTSQTNWLNLSQETGSSLKGIWYKTIIQGNLSLDPSLSVRSLRPKGRMTTQGISGWNYTFIPICRKWMPPIRSVITSSKLQNGGTRRLPLPTMPGFKPFLKPSMRPRTKVLRWSMAWKPMLSMMASPLPIRFRIWTWMRPPMSSLTWRRQGCLLSTIKLLNWQRLRCIREMSSTALRPLSIQVTPCRPLPPNWPVLRMPCCRTHQRKKLSSRTSSSSAKALF